MSDNQSKEPQQLPFLYKIGAIILGTSAALLMVYFGFRAFNFIYGMFTNALEAIPADNTLPPALQSMNPVIWEEANRITRASR